MGLAIEKVPSPTQLRSDLETVIATPVDRLRSFVLAWCIDGKTIGHSSLKDIVPRESGSIHLHMWRADLDHPSGVAEPALSLWQEFCTPAT